MGSVSYDVLLKGAQLCRLASVSHVQACVAKVGKHRGVLSRGGGD